MNDRDVAVIGFNRIGIFNGQQIVQRQGDFFIAEDENFIQELDDNDRLELEQIRRNIHEERKVAENILFRFSNDNLVQRNEPAARDGENSNRSREEQPINIFQNIIRDNQNEEDSRSCGTIISEIPFEEIQTIGNQTEEKLNEYNCFEDCQLHMKFIQWQKDSHGLFDYEMKQISKQHHKALTDKKVLRKGSQIIFVDPDVDIRGKYGNEYQEMFTIRKERNRFFIHGVKPFDINQDIDDCYLESGEPILPPIQMRERMFNVVRFLKAGQRLKDRDFLLKKNDVVKMGRIKLKVQNIFLSQKVAMREQKIKRRKERVDYEKKQFEKQPNNMIKDDNNQNSEMKQNQQIEKSQISDQIYENVPVSQDKKQEPFISKYPDDYFNISLGSDKSYYKPIVGEINYVNAKVPLKPKKIEEELKKPELDLLIRNDEDIDFQLKRKHTNQKGNNQGLSNQNQRERNLFLLRNSQDNDINQGNISQQLLNNFHENDPINISSLNDRPLNRDQNNLVPRNQRDLTGNSRPNKNMEEEKQICNQIFVNPSSLLQQIQRDIIGIDQNLLIAQQQSNMVNQILSNVMNQQNSLLDQNSARGVNEQSNIDYVNDDQIKLLNMINQSKIQSKFKNDNRVQDQNNIINLQKKLKCQQKEEEKKENRNDFENIRYDDLDELNKYLDSQNKIVYNQLNNKNNYNLLLAKHNLEKSQNEEIQFKFQNEREEQSFGIIDQSNQKRINRRSSYIQQSPMRQQAQQRNNRRSNLFPSSMEENIFQNKVPIHSMDQVVDYRIHQSSSFSSSSLSSHKSWQENKKQERISQRRNIRLQKREERFKKREELRQEQEILIESMNRHLLINQVKQSQNGLNLSKINYDGSEISQLSQVIDVLDAEDSQIDGNTKKYKEQLKNKDVISLTSQSNPNCRLCWDDEFNSDNPLLQICQCRGGVEFIHFQCLKSWLKTKEYRQVTPHYTSIYWRQFQCEICKSSLPYVFRNNNRNYSLIDIPTFQRDYMVLESLTLEQKHSRMVHVLHPDFNSIRPFTGKYMIGRGQDCDIKVSDISVSRYHCEIRYKNGKFWLQDTLSKFGTLALARKPVEISSYLTSGMQIGRSLVLFQTRPLTPKQYKVGNFLADKKIEAQKNVFKFRQKRQDDKDKEIQMQKRNFKKNPLRMLPQTEEEINKKYKLQNLNVDEYLDYIEKEMHMSEFLENQIKEHDFLKQKEQEEYERKKNIERFLQNQKSSSFEIKAENGIQDIQIKNEKKKKKEKRKNINVQNKSKSYKKDISQQILGDLNDVKLDRKALILEKNIKRISIESDDQYLSKIQYVEKSSIEPNFQKGTFKKIAQIILDQNNNLAQSINEKIEDINIEEQDENQKFKLIYDQINYGITRNDLKIQPSQEYLRAFGLIESLGGKPKIPDRQQILDEPPKDIELEVNQYKKAQRLILSIQQQCDYLASQRAKLMQGEHKGQSLGQILGVKFPNKVAISRSFYKASDKKGNIISQLNEKKKQILMLSLAEQEALKFEKRNNLNNQKAQGEEQKYENIQKLQDSLSESGFKGSAKVQENQINQVCYRILQPRDKKLDLKFVKENCEEQIKEIDQEIKFVHQLDQRHQELIKSQSEIHKSLQDIWRRQLQAQLDSHKRLENLRKN